MPEAPVKQPIADELVGNAHGNLARVRELLEANPELVDANASWNETPIQAATQMGNRPIMDYLIGRGAPVDFFTSLVLGQAAEIERHPELVNGRGIHDLPALYFAAIGGHLETAGKLIEAGTDVNASAQAAAPIHGAVMGGSSEMVRLLLDHGADPSLKDYAERDARSLAMAMTRPDLAQLFD
ncbi:MAG TPA: ankyrin repeat domain-containing protein [Candidatus Dormibacteraeota bacterium]